MALDSYSGLSTAIGTWGERTYVSTQSDEFIALAESKANRRLAQDFRRRTSATIITDADGFGTLPTGFVGMTSLVRDVTGSTPLKQVSWDGLVTRNPFEIADDASVYAINGTVIRVAPVTTDTYVAKFSSTIPALSASNTSNWLMALAPDYYLFAGRAAASAFHEDFNSATSWTAAADAVLSELIAQGNVAEYGNAELTLEIAP